MANFNVNGDDPADQNDTDLDPEMETLALTLIALGVKQMLNPETEQEDHMIKETGV